MTVVIDTNVVLQGQVLGHPLRRIFDAWLDGAFAWAVSTEILLEYEEVVTIRAGTGRWLEFARFMDQVAELQRSSLLRVSPTYRFHVITGCPDDDKFADCAITAGADYLVTEDAHFQALAGSGYRPQPIAPAAFIERFLIVQP